MLIISAFCLFDFPIPKSLEKPVEITKLVNFARSSQVFYSEPKRFVRRVVLLIALGTFSPFGGNCMSQETAGNSVYQQPMSPGFSQGTESVSSKKQAERLVSTMLSRLGRVESVSARIRQRTRSKDMVVVGTGRYLQQGRGIDQQFRFEVVNKADTETFEFLEVSDGLSFWQFRKNTDNPVQLARVDISQVRTKLEDFGIEKDQAVAPYLGGLQRSLALLRHYFRFESAEKDSLEGLPVWRVAGQWNTTVLASILPQHIMPPDALEGGVVKVPDGMPCSVELIIGSEQLFPFRITWNALGDRGEIEPMSILELYEVRLEGSIDSAAFVYKPSSEGLVDKTEQVVQQIQPLRQ